MMAGNSVNAMNRTRTCGRCGAEVPDFAPDRLCLHCLFDSAYDPDPATSSERDGYAPAAPGSCGPPSTATFGEYDLLGELGRGGQGKVYRARHRVLGRTVALKVVPASGLAGQTARERFRLEAATASQLVHPNIVPIYEVGERDGFSYYTMKLMEGGTIDQALKPGVAEGSPPHLIARLMSRVAQAVHHAHQRGVLHRDLKPSNILLDAELEPHVTDFGLARWLEQESSLTLSHAILGTAAYLAPEIARHGASQATVASDVYGLGAVLYELLAGRPPFIGASLAEILRKVQEEEAALPRKSPIPNPKSAILDDPTNPQSSMTNPQSPIAERERKFGIADWGFRIGDLETICLKCLEKEPAKRYPTAQALADDLQRFLHDEPILARPVTQVERAWRWCRRKPALAATLLLVFLLVLVLGIGSPIAAYRINEARRQATEEAAIAAAMNEFLTEDLLRQADVWKAEAHASPNRDIRLLEVVNRASAGVEAKFSSQPIVAAKIHLTVGSVYAGLGEIEKAEHHLRTAKALFETHVGPDDLRTLEANHTLAVLLRVNRAAYEEAETLIRQVFTLRQRTLGPDHHDTLSAMLELADIRSARNDYVTAGALFTEATRLATLAVGADDPLALRGREAEIETIRGRGEWHTARRLQEELWETRKRVQGESHPDTLNSLWTLAWLTQRSEADYPRVEQLVEEGLKLSRPVLGDHGATHELELTRSSLLKYKGLIRASRELREQRLAIAERFYGPAHPATIGSRHYVAYLQASVGIQPLEALRILEDCLEVHRRIAPDSRGAQINRNWVASVYWQLGQTEDCLAIWQENLEIRQQLYGPKSPSALQAIQSLGDLNARLGDWAAASAFLNEFAQSESAAVRDRIKAALARALSQAGTLLQDWPPANWAQVVTSGDESDASPLLASLLLLSISEGFAHQQADGGLSGRGENTANLSAIIQAVAQHLIGDIPLVERRILTGLLGIADQQWDDAIEQLEPVASGAPDPEARILAGYLISLAHVHQGFDTEAQHAFDHAEMTLRRLVAAGELGHRWDRLALGLVIRNHAAEFLPNLGAPEAIDSTYLAEARQRWEPVQAALQRTFLLARGRQWTEAATAFQAAMATDGFTWEAAELSVYRWPIKVALILASAGEPLARDISRLNPFDSQMLSPDAVAISLFPIRTMGDARESFWLDALRFDAELLEVNIPGPPGWRCLLNGLMHLQHGRPRDALAELCEAETSYNLQCAGAASAYRAQVSFHLKDFAQAHAALERAEAILLQLRENEGENLGEVWVEQSLLELALDEARQMAESTPPAS